MALNKQQVSFDDKLSSAAGDTVSNKSLTDDGDAVTDDDIKSSVHTYRNVINIINKTVDEIEKNLKTIPKMQSRKKLKIDNTLSKNTMMKDFESSTFSEDNDDPKLHSKKLYNSLNKETDIENTKNTSHENELNDLRKQNERLNQEKEQQADSILELAANFETVKENIEKLLSEVNRLKKLKEAENENISNFFTSSSITSSNCETSSLQPTSLPNLYSNTASKTQSKMQNEIKFSETHIEKLKHINIQLQTRNNKLEIKMEQLREQARTLNEKIQQFNAKINPNSSEVVRLNPQQQQYYDDFRRRLELQVEHYKKAAVEEKETAQQTKTAALQDQAEAENKFSDLKRLAEHLENEDRKITAQTEELRTALVVATRVSPQSISVRNQATIENLRATTRRLEDNIRRISTQYDNALAEKLRLQEQVEQLRRGSRYAQQTIYNRGPNSHIIFSNEGVTISQESEENRPADIDLD